MEDLDLCKMYKKKAVGFPAAFVLLEHLRDQAS